MGAVLELRALGRALAAPAAGEVQDLGRPHGQRQHRPQGTEVEHGGGQVPLGRAEVDHDRQVERRHGRALQPEATRRDRGTHGDMPGPGGVDAVEGLAVVERGAELEAVRARALGGERGGHGIDADFDEGHGEKQILRFAQDDKESSG